MTFNEKNYDLKKNNLFALNGIKFKLFPILTNLIIFWIKLLAKGLILTFKVWGSWGYS